jgi:hypothetical protein
MFQRLTLRTLCLAALTLAPAFAQENKFTERLLQNRYQIAVQEGRLSGTGVGVLQNALTGAQFVLIGEDHGISQIPQFAGAVCDLLGPQGFHTMAVETGPLAADELQQWIATDSSRESLIAFEKKFPETIAFYNYQEEYDLLTHCVRAAQGREFRLWGLDQELMGASGLILTRILATHPGKQAADEAQRLLQKNDDSHAVAVKSGSPGDIFMMTASDDELNKLRDLLQTEGNATSQALIEALIKSRDIYQKNMNGSGYESNRERALLMKSYFVSDYKQATQADGAPPKVLFKFGAWHMYKGINPLRNNDMGNFVTEFADSQGTTSLHIAILGVKGSQLRFAGIGRPAQPGILTWRKTKTPIFCFSNPCLTTLKTKGGPCLICAASAKDFTPSNPSTKKWNG